MALARDSVEPQQAAIRDSQQTLQLGPSVERSSVYQLFGVEFSHLTRFSKSIFDIGLERARWRLPARCQSQNGHKVVPPVRRESGHPTTHRTTDNFGSLRLPGSCITLK
jgi:hypothetical protein